jgi:hypothetical protein
MDRLAAFLDTSGTSVPAPEAPGSGDGPAVADAPAATADEPASPSANPPRKPQHAQAPGLAAALALADMRH